MASPAQPLSEELEEFMQSAGDDGVILVSFGTILGSLDENVLQMMATAFSRLPQKVIWKIKTGAFLPFTLMRYTVLLLLFFLLLFLQFMKRTEKVGGHLSGRIGRICSPTIYAFVKIIFFMKFPTQF